MIIKYLIKLPIFKRLIPSLFKKYIFFTKNHWKLKKIEGVKYLLDTRYLIDRNFYLRENYEDELFFLTQKIIIKNKIDFFLDLGACWGIYSLRLSKIKKLKIMAFDPIDKNLNRLKEMIRINNIKNIKFFLSALGNIKGKVKFYGLEKFTPNYSIYDKKNKNTYIADINKLDNLVKIKNKTLYLKVDVESHEYYLFLGAKQLLQNNKITIQCEVIKNKRKVFKLFKKNKFKLLYHKVNTDDYIFSNYIEEI